MKHIISLSLKYIRRQKLRTFLTFMCVMLSAFILATVCTYGSSGYTTLYNETLKEDGTWELEINSWIQRAADPEKALDIAIHHAVTADYFTYSSDIASYSGSYNDNSGRISLFEVSDGSSTHLVRAVTAVKEDGNQKLVRYYRNVDIPDSDITKEGVYVPEFLKEMGYSTGDTVTLTIRPMTAGYDEDSEAMKTLRANLLEKYGTQYTSSDPEFQNLSKETQKKATRASIASLLEKQNIGLQDSPYTDKQYGTAKKVTFTIAGFNRYSKSDNFVLTNGKGFNISLEDLIDTKTEGVETHGNSSVYLRLTDTCDYDDALKMLFTDLGHNYENDFYNSSEYGYRTNDLLLGLEMKSPYAMYKEFGSIAAPALVVLLIAWFISRFVIDCTFEMAVHERSSHFAALRIIGASKGQIAALVFIEAIFYCLTAVPLGIGLAIFLCRGSINALYKSGIDVFEFSAKPVFIAIGAFLTIIAIFISAYTSAMWAARKLSPAEALNFGKPRSNKKRKKHSKKSKLNLSAKKFIRRYTKKNIKSAKSRFVISTITMALGVLMFTFSAIALIFAYGEIKEGLIVSELYDETYDFYIDGYYSGDPKNITGDIDKYFGDKEIFSECSVTGYYLCPFSDRDGSVRIVKEKLLRSQTIYGIGAVHIINEKIYNKYELDVISGMSYQEFVSKKAALFNNSIYGSYEERDTDDDGKLIEKYETSYYDLKDGYKLTTTYGDRIKVIGKISSRSTINGLIVPLENSAEFNMTYSIGLTVNGSKHYREAVKLFNEFVEKNNLEMAENLYSMNTGLHEFIFAIVKIVLIFLVSIWLVGILSMINSVNTSVLNRSRELMMLRSVGMTKKQLRRSIMLETLIFSATAAISGTLIGVIAARLVGGRFNMHELTAYVLPVVIISLTLNIVIALLASIPAIRSLGKVESIAQASNE
ncbi:MAG: ABC transporter permease [Ruminococcus sp.]|nr:ABC transporter permease [Ruminococcus sp.]